MVRPGQRHAQGLRRIVANRDRMMRLHRSVGVGQRGTAQRRPVSASVLLRNVRALPPEPRAGLKREGR
jgi:hypothetical protein